MLTASEYAAIVYADIFDYPLTREEISKWQIKVYQNTYAAAGEKWKSRNGHYYLEGRGEIVELRKKRGKWSKEKMRIAEKIARLLQKIPIVWGICVTGSLAMNNSDKKEDIDLLIITAPGKLWTTRLLCVFLTEILGVRRHRLEKNIENKICLNIFLDGQDLLIRNQNLYTAHEVGQAKCLYEKENSYQKFILINDWILSYLPNYQLPIFNFQSIINYQLSITNLLEKISRTLQLYFMKSHVTTEKITETQLFFHPESREKKVLDKMRYLAIK